MRRIAKNCTDISLETIGGALCAIAWQIGELIIHLPIPCIKPCPARMYPPAGIGQFRAQLFQVGKSDKITFSKIKFLTLEHRGDTCFLKKYEISVKKLLSVTVICLMKYFCRCIVYFQKKKENHV